MSSNQSNNNNNNDNNHNNNNNDDHPIFHREFLPLSDDHNEHSNNNNKLTIKHEQTQQTQQNEQQSNNKITIMSYNILAQRLINRRSSFYYVSKKAAKWKFRKQQFQQEFTKISKKIDIFCLQEVDFYEEFWRDFLSSLGYQTIFQPKTTNKRELKMYGILIAYRKDKFILEKYQPIEFSDLANEEPNRIHSLELAKSNVGQIIALKIKKLTGDRCDNNVESSSLQNKDYNEEKGIIISNCHCFWRVNYLYTKLRQLHYLFKSIKHFNKNLNYPIISCGDFNLTPNTILYNFLCKERNNLSDDLIYENFKLPKDIFLNTTVIELNRMLHLQEEQLNNNKLNNNNLQNKDEKSVNDVNNNENVNNEDGMRSPMSEMSTSKSDRFLYFFDSCTNLENLENQQEQHYNNNLQNKQHNKQNNQELSNNEETKEEQEQTKNKEIKKEEEEKPLEWYLSKLHYTLHDELLINKEKRLHHVKKYLNDIKHQVPLLKSVYSNYHKVDPYIYNGLEQDEERFFIDKNHPPYTTFTAEFFGVLDYIFIYEDDSNNNDNNNDKDLEGFRNQYPKGIVPLKLLSIPHHEVLREQTALPNEYLSSDHIGICAQFEIK
ncbi:hypothetical protein ABK040_010578 [Willaertia magna]